MRPCASLLLASLLFACSSSEQGEPGTGGSAPSGGKSTEAAGVVIEVAGTVTARLAGTKEYRTLAVDSPVYAKDTITTAREASVRIRLHHNDAVLALTGDKSRQLEQTAAWRAPRGASAGLLDGEIESSTAAAGRHAERAAADTRATAPKRGEPPAAAPPPPAPAPQPAPAPEPERRPKRAKKQPGKQAEPGPIAPKTELPPPPPPDPQRGLLTQAPSLPNTPPRANVQAGIAAIKSKVEACKASHRGTGVVKVRFTIAPSGKVTSAQVVSSPDPALGACVVAAVQSASFAASKSGTSVVYPFTF